MEIRRLGSDVISKIRSSFSVNSFAQCVFELVCNSLDAKSTSIAVRINLITFRIQVADNGEGISKENMELMGVRYMTNRCHNLKQLEKHLSFYGFRGETLSSIVEMCNSLNVTSKSCKSNETYSKTLTHNLRSEVKLTKNRPCYGTTVTIDGFMSKLPVRQQRVIQEIELDEVKKFMESLIIINPGTSFSLRNDVTGLLVLNSPKSTYIIGSFRYLHPEINDSFKLLKVSKNKVIVDALIHKELANTRKCQYIYVNKRPVLSPKIIKYIRLSFHKKTQSKRNKNKSSICENKKYPVYVLNIRCPHSYVDIFMSPSKVDIEFTCWDLVLACIEKIINTFFGLDQKKTTNLPVKITENAETRYGVSHLFGAVQACAFKRKSDDTMEVNEGDVSQHGNSVEGDVQEHNLFVGKSKVRRLDRKQWKKSQEFDVDKIKVKRSQDDDSSGNYLIEDSGKQEMYVKPCKVWSVMMKPLPIKVDQKVIVPVKNDDQFMEVGGDGGDHQMIAVHTFDQKSTYSGLNDNEDQGKNLIMDMFLKSTQVFTEPDQNSEVSRASCGNVSKETIMESNFVMENNYQDPVRGVNTTMSISVNVKKRKLKNARKKDYTDRKVSKCIQTSLQNETKCLQTSLKPGLRRVRSNVSELTRNLDKFKLKSPENDADFVDNYTILINTVRKKREFTFVRKSMENMDDTEEFRPVQLCQCKMGDGKVFRFGKNKKTGETVDRREKDCDTKCALLTEMPRNNGIKIYENKHQDKDETVFKRPVKSKSRVINKRFKENRQNGVKNMHFKIDNHAAKLLKKDFSNNCEKSPYFIKKSGENFDRNALKPEVTENRVFRPETNILHQTYKDFQPVFKSTQFECNKNYNSRRNSLKVNGFCGENQPNVAVNVSPYFANNDFGKATFPHMIGRNKSVALTNRRCLHENADFGLENNDMWENGYCKEKSNNNILEKNPNFGIGNNYNPGNPGVRQTDYSVKDFKNTSFVTENSNLNTKHQSFSQNFNKVAKHLEPNQEMFDLDGPSWTMPDISNENLYFERTFSENQGTGVVPKNIFKNIEEANLTKKNGENNKKFTFEFSSAPKDLSIDIFESSANMFQKNINKTSGHLTQENFDWAMPTVSNKSLFFERSFSENKNTQVITPINIKNATLEKNTKNCHSVLSKNIDIDFFESNQVQNRPNTVLSNKEDSNLEITLLNIDEKQIFLEKELNLSKENNTKTFLSCESKLHPADFMKIEDSCREKSRIIVDSQNEWIRQYNDAGNRFYMNNRTGMVTFKTPKLDQVQFCFEKRLDFIPKGMSPILKEHKKVDRTLSQNAKTKLHEFIMKSYENELMVVKWENYISDDPKTFFNEMYKEKTKLFESCIPSIENEAVKSRNPRNIVSFSKKMFQSMEIIGQVDKKFIAVLEKSKNLIVLFDQHAVHERIRVERYLKEYKGTKTPCKEKLIFFIPRNDLSMLKKYLRYLDSLGLELEFFTNGLSITSIPLCIYERYQSNDNPEDFSKILNTLLKEIIDSLKSTRGSSTQLPKIIQNIINLKACRGAIKFGDILSKEECTRLLKDLSLCQLPFQCAHGRPSLTPVLPLNKVEYHKKAEKPDFKKFQRATR